MTRFVQDTIAPSFYGIKAEHEIDSANTLKTLPLLQIDDRKRHREVDSITRGSYVKFAL